MMKMSIRTLWAFAHCRPGKLLVGSADGYKVIKCFNLACRHSREGGNPSLLLHQSNMDSSLLKAEHIHVLSPRTRFRGNDGHEDFCGHWASSRGVTDG